MNGGTPGRRAMGPGWVVAAAFVGPGTVTTATLAGAGFGYALAWALVLAVAVTFVLQEAAARVALATGRPLAGVLLDALSPRARVAVAALLVGGIGLGNAAFQAGNLAGASLGLGLLLPAPTWLWAVAIADLAFLALWFGRPRWVERIMVGLVGLMGLCFLLTLTLARVDWGAALAGSLVPTMPHGAELLVVALVGTTVVPYNLFLHAALARRRGWGPGDMGPMRRDAATGILAGGAISLAIVLTSAATLRGASVASGADMARQLDPLLGPLASGAFAVGLFAAGFSSAITAPLAAGYVLGQVLGGSEDERTARFRVVWAGVLLVGLLPVLAGVQAVPLIVAAQALNGLLLPLVAVLVVRAAGAADMGPLRSRGPAAAMAWASVAVAALLGLMLLARTVLGR